MRVVTGLQHIVVTASTLDHIKNASHSKPISVLVVQVLVNKIKEYVWILKMIHAHATEQGIFQIFYNNLSTLKSASGKLVHHENHEK